MGYMKEEKILEFLDELKENILKYEDKHFSEYGSGYFDDSYVRYGSKIANLWDMVNLGEKAAGAFSPAECSVEEFYDDPYVDVFISCEGSAYEAVYGYVSRGGNEEAKDLHDAFEKAATNHGLTMDFADGALVFQSEESWEKQNEELKKEQEQIDREIQSWKSDQRGEYV